MEPDRVLHFCASGYTMPTKNPRRGRSMLLLLGSLLALPGCALLQSLLGQTPRPTASVAGVRLAEFSLTGATLIFDVAIQNPYAVPLPLVNVDYALSSQSLSFLSGQAPLEGTIAAGGSKTVSLPAKLVFLDILKI